MGVSVKLTSMLTMIVAAIVMPNDFRNRPTMPSIMAIGKNTATSESVMASTARPISAVAARRLVRRAALLFDVAKDVLHHHNRVVDHDAHRKRQRQQREAVQGEAHVIDDREGGDDRSRNRQRGDDRGANVGQEEEHHDGRQRTADHQVLLHRIDRGLDEDRLVAADLQVVIFRQGLAKLGQPLLRVATSTVFVPDCLRIFKSTQGVSLRNETLLTSSVESSAWPKSPMVMVRPSRLSTVMASISRMLPTRPIMRSVYCVGPTFIEPPGIWRF